MKKRIITLLVTMAVLAPAACTGAEAAAFETAIPAEYIAYCEEIGGEYHVSPEVLEAIIEHESGGDPTVGLERTRCYGLMGVSAKWNAERMDKLDVDNLHDGYGNILVATDLLLELFEKHEDPYEVLRFYGGYPEGDYRFSEEIMERAWELEIIHGKHEETKG